MVDNKTQRFYNANFKKKNRARILEKHECEICHGTYTYFNKSKHATTKKHLNALAITPEKKEIKIEGTSVIDMDDFLITLIVTKKTH